MPVSPHRPALAGDRVCMSASRWPWWWRRRSRQAQDAADKIVVDYAPLDAVTDAREAVKPGAPQLWPEAPGNIAFDWTAPADPDGKKQAALDSAFKDAAHVVRVELVNQRLVVAALEPRSATASYDAQAKTFTLALPVAIGGRHARPGRRLAQRQAGGAARLDRRRRRRLRHEGRGASGICRAAARRARARQPVHWLSTRSEAFLSDAQGRDSFWTVELALSARGNFLGLRVNCLGNMGAYITPVAHFIVTTHISGCLPTVYDIPHAQVNTRCVFTNTLPTAPYRGAGRPEAGYLIERVVDAAADRLGIDAAELRRRNLIEPEQMPYTTAFGNTYDSGEFPAAARARAGACRLCRLSRAQEGGEEGAQAARHRHRLLSGDRRRLPGRGRPHLLSRRQQGHCQRRRRRQRAGPSDRVRQSGRAPARHRRRRRSR